MIRCYEDLVTETKVPSVRETKMKILKKIHSFPKVPKFRARSCMFLKKI
jgi:hypothetical protein